MVYTCHTGSYNIIQKGCNQTPMTSHNYSSQEGTNSGAPVPSLSTNVKFVKSQKTQVFYHNIGFLDILLTDLQLYHTIGFIKFLLTDLQLIKKMHRLVNSDSC
jgi:hypothetical protein